MTTGKKILIFILFIVLVAFAYNALKEKPIETTPATTPQPVTTPIPATGEPYVGTTFSFKSAPGYEVTHNSGDTPWRINTNVTGQLLAQVKIPDSHQPQTNFRDATFTVGLSNDAQAIQECLIPTNGERAKGTIIINGVTFHKITLTDAGAGNYYDTTSYRAMHNNDCYAVEYMIHTTNINNYSPEQGIKEFDTKSTVALLEGMVQSFAFLK